jgi:hypothetical protein
VFWFACGVGELLTKAQADAVADRLDVGLDIDICYACLGFVCHALDDPPRALLGVLLQFTPYLWAEGLAEPALAAARRACELGVPYAREALADLEERGGRCRVARALVLRLAVELQRQTRMELRIEEIARSRLGLAPPELN